MTDDSFWVGVDDEGLGIGWGGLLVLLGVSKEVYSCHGTGRVSLQGCDLSQGLGKQSKS